MFAVGTCLLPCLPLNAVVCYLSSPKRYGFRKPPYVELKARPKLGEREVTLVHVTDWIEKKLEQEFQVNVWYRLVCVSHESQSSGQNRGSEFHLGQDPLSRI